MIVPVDGRQSVIVADVPTQMSSSSIPVSRCNVNARTNNTGDVFIGGSLVRSESGFESGDRLRPGETRTLIDTDLSLWWIVGGTAGDGVFWGGERETSV